MQRDKRIICPPIHLTDRGLYPSRLFECFGCDGIPAHHRFDRLAHCDRRRQQPRKSGRLVCRRGQRNICAHAHAKQTDGLPMFMCIHPDFLRVLHALRHGAGQLPPLSISVFRQVKAEYLPAGLSGKFRQMGRCGICFTCHIAVHGDNHAGVFHAPDAGGNAVDLDSFTNHVFQPTFHESGFALQEAIGASPQIRETRIAAVSAPCDFPFRFAAVKKKFL